MNGKISLRNNLEIHFKSLIKLLNMKTLKVTMGTMFLINNIQNVHTQMNTVNILFIDHVRGAVAPARLEVGKIIPP